MFGRDKGALRLAAATVERVPLLGMTVRDGEGDGGGKS